MPPKGTTNGKKNSCPKDGTKVDDEAGIELILD
jgi:hypothetical protein